MKLGRYEVVQHLESGGMADVLLARTLGIEGFERHVVIKRIRAEQARDTRYVTMFLDEARLAASLHHANVVQVNDIGQEDGEYFLAMEYVHGEDARKLLNRAAAREARIPLEHVLSIVIAAAAGLHHAHEQIRPDGASLGIVHRDVSPANILIGYDGGVKVVDFGIAKAAHQAPNAAGGMLEGKLAYMSPEQVTGDPVDRRSDVFALGIVLWELCCVRPLFNRRADDQIITAILHEPVPPPSTIRGDLPRGLEAIIMKALSFAPAERYATTDEMRRALEQFATAAGVRTSATALADYMAEMFGTKREPWLVRAATGDEEAAFVLDDDGDDDCEIEVAGDARRAIPLPLPPPIESGAIVLGVGTSPAIARGTGEVEAWDSEVAQVVQIAPHELAVGAVDPPRPSRPRTSPSQVTRALLARLPAPWRRRAPWIAGATLLLAISIVAFGGGSTSEAAPALSLATPPTPAPITARAADAPPPPAPAAAAVAPRPVAKTAKRMPARPQPVKPQVKPHWDPNALFPRGR